MRRFWHFEDFGESAEAEGLYICFSTLPPESSTARANGDFSVSEESVMLAYVFDAIVSLRESFGGKIHNKKLMTESIKRKTLSNSEKEVIEKDKDRIRAMLKRKGFN